MADYFTKFSLDMNLPDESAQKYALHLANQAREIYDGGTPPTDFPASLVEATEDWQFDTEAETHTRYGIWMHSDYGGVDAACSFIQHLLQRFDPKEYLTLEWSYDCSKPRVDGYGGGAAMITAKSVKTIGTGPWLQKQVIRFQALKSQ